MPIGLGATGSLASALFSGATRLAALLLGAALFLGAALLPGAALAQVPLSTPGGLQPPPPLAEPEIPRGDGSQAEQETRRELERAEREDSGRGLQYLWLEPELGYQWLGLETLGSEHFLDENYSSGHGFSLGVAAGARLLFFTLGARVRYAPLNRFDLWHYGGELGYRIPWGRFEPYASVGVHYARLVSFSGTDAVATGLGASAAAGFDFFVTPVFSVGARLEGATSWLTRDPTSGGGFYGQKGSATALALHSALVLGLHY